MHAMTILTTALEHSQVGSPTMAKPPAQKHNALTPEVYLQLKADVLAHEDAAALVDNQDLTNEPPDGPDDMMLAVIWTIVSINRSKRPQINEVFNIRTSLLKHRPVLHQVGHARYSAAIEEVWQKREVFYESFMQASQAGPIALVEWARAVPGVDFDHCHVLLNSLGQQVVAVAPKSWLCRLAGLDPRRWVSDLERLERCQALYSELSAGTGDSFDVIDRVLFSADLLGLLDVQFEAPQSH